MSEAGSQVDQVNQEVDNVNGGQIALVTGANRGLGREIVRQLSKRGMTVILGARDPGKGEKAAAEISSDSGEILPRRLDVTDQTTIDALASEVEERFGRLDVLVNNAGVHYDSYQQALDADLSVVEEAFTTNTLGPWRMCQAFVPLLRNSGYGRLVNVSSGAGTLNGMRAGTPAYKVSKAAVNALTLMLASELAGTGILVNAAGPGWTATDMGGSGGRSVEDGAASIVWAATLPDDGPSGGFFRDGEPLSW